MPNFIWTAKDKFGKPVIREVAAETIEESKAILLAAGCTDLGLKTDEIMDTIRDSSAYRTEDRLEHMVRYIDEGPRSFFKFFWEILLSDIKRTKWTYLFIIAAVCFSLYRGILWLPISVVIIYAGVILFMLWIRLPGIYHRKLYQAKDWHHWQEVLRIVNRMEKFGRIRSNKMQQMALVRARAQALAGLGKLPDALIEFQRCENQPGMPTWLYKGFLGEIYDSAKEYDKSLECSREALEEKKIPTLYLEVADKLLRFKKDIKHAREALTEAEKSTLPDLMKPYYLRCKGILAYIEGRYASARQNIDAAIEILNHTKHRLFWDGQVSVLKSYLCCVLAKQGEVAAAKEYFAQVKRYLEATDQTELLEECRKAIEE